MRTTVDIAPEILVAAKKQAAELHKPLRDLIETALRAYLREGHKMTASTKMKEPLKWYTVEGGLPNIDISSREEMHEWIRKQT